MPGKLRIIRITTGGMFQAILLKGQLAYLNRQFEMISVSEPDQYLETVRQREGVETIGIPMSREIDPVNDLRSWFRLRKMLKIQRPDIIHSSTPKAGLLAMSAAWAVGVPVRMLTPTGFRFVGLTGLKRRLVFFFEKIPFRFANQIFPESQGVINTIHRYHMTNKPLRLIGNGSVNGVNLEIFSRSAIDQRKLQDIKGSIAYDDKLTYLLFVGRIVKDKGITELMNAFNKLPANHRLIILGPFEQGDPVPEETVKAISNNSSVIHINWTDDVQYYIHLSHLVVHPSYREGLPNVLLQAGAMECPVLCSRIEGNTDIVSDKITGILFEPADDDDLYQKLRYALDNPRNMRTYATALRQKIEDQFDQRLVNKALADTYRSLQPNSHL